MDANLDVVTETPGEIEEPPERKSYFSPQPRPGRLDTARLESFVKHLPPAFARRESLLTRQLTHTESEQVDDELQRARAVVRGMSTWSNPSVASTASLTSDNDLTSPGTRDSTPSPTLPPTMVREQVPILEKVTSREPVIANQSPEKTVEAGLGRRRCITFACGRKPSEKAVTKEVIEEEPKPEQRPDPPKRKCTLTFACPTRPTPQTALSALTSRKAARNTSPAPVIRTPRASGSPAKTTRPLPSPRATPRTHRGSDSTAKNESPKSLRKPPPGSMRRRKYSDDNQDVPSEERRFHEFGPIQSEAEQWLEESTCHRNRLTVNDTLVKENIIRRIGEEVEEEALEDDDFDEDDLEDDEEEDEDVDADENDDDDDVESGASDSEVSDAGFQTDDEDGFAVSDSENEDDSDTEWWTAGRSTAATSTEHLDHIRLSPRRRSNSQSSMESDSAEHVHARPPQGKMKRKTGAIKIHRPVIPDLPDSTDFVCGTLDEDRPLEQAYISCLEQRKAAKHKARPQDIDPTFPTSDPEMDEEDDDDESQNEQKVADESEAPTYFQHGKIDLNNEDSDRRGRTKSATEQKKKSPSPPHQRLRSPPPAKRIVHRSPPPPAKRHPRSPPGAKRTKSPAPTKRIAMKSPPPSTKRTSTKSPPPRRLFSETSPKRMRSPAPTPRRPVASPPPSRRMSADKTSNGIDFTPRATLAQRPQPTHTASLPRVASAIKIGRVSFGRSISDHDEVYNMNTRGAIDIVKGLEKKRQRRREKLYQKHCKVKDREHKRPRPGKGAERMREVGLELAAYKGKKVEHMLSY